MAEAAAYSLRGEEGGVRLVAPLLSDAAGSLVRGMMQKKGMDTGGLFAPDTEVETEARSTPVASLLLDGETNDLLSGVVAMQLVEHSFDEQRVRHSLEEHAKGTRVVGFDANLPVEGMEALLRWKGAQRENGKEAPLLLFEPTSVQKCARFLDAVAALRSGRAGKQGASGEGQGKGKALLDVATPNLLELRAMHQRALQLNLIPRQLAIMSTPTTAPSASADLEEILRLAGPLATLCHLFLVTLGPKGVLAVYHNKRGEVEHQHLDIDQPLGAGEVRSTTGAGDSFAGGVMAMLASAPRPAKGQAWEGWLRTLCEAGSRAAKASLKSYDAVAAPPPSSSVKG
ncbi:hypothetical protein BDZ90DRAFT_231225 [Jaminaea rosea]|uniref:Carbohydrate kinase PfkB domain-containing protein n=1 Tax=Jaminaea rosea TaxID=1569628 RepID=A0A316UVB4_9BASI|nr:hypothetical protein BDZ90DRAFT_231225 [Jaminaea rosea]PWN29247.1 hypothetical protein BDZ90DRAFT_231225 [Jaminaea rosea]